MKPRQKTRSNHVGPTWQQRARDKHRNEGKKRPGHSQIARAQDSRLAEKREVLGDDGPAYPDEEDQGEATGPVAPRKPATRPRQRQSKCHCDARPEGEQHENRQTCPGQQAPEAQRAGGGTMQPAHIEAEELEDRPGGAVELVPQKRQREGLGPGGRLTAELGKHARLHEPHDHQTGGHRTAAPGRSAADRSGPA